MPSCSAIACACAMLRTLCEPNADGHGRFVLEQNPRERFKIRVALRFLQKDRNRPAVLAALDFFVIPVGAFDQTNGETRAALATPRN